MLIDNHQRIEINMVVQLAGTSSVEEIGLAGMLSAVVRNSGELEHLQWLAERAVDWSVISKCSLAASLIVVCRGHVWL